MTNLLKTLQDEVAHFQSWAATYPTDERSGEWECDYDDWPRLYDAFIDFVATTTCQQWSTATTDMLLYVIARDNETGQLIREVGRKPENLSCLAERAAESAEPDAKWQMAVELSHIELPPVWVGSLLLRFAHDANEYVRRRALIALADIKSPFVADLIEPAWNTGLEYQRMAVLKALSIIGSPELDSYLARVETDGRQNVVHYAEGIRAGTAD